MNITQIPRGGPSRPIAWAARSLLLASLVLGPAAALAAESQIPSSQPLREPSKVVEPSRWLFGGQVTAVGLLVPGFRGPYRNPEVSFGGPDLNHGWSFVATILGGVRLWDGAVAVAQPEFADGIGTPNVSGVAGYIDGNIIRVAKVGKDPYLARLFFQQDIVLGGAEAGEEGVPEDGFMPAGPTAMRRGRTESRLSITAGKFAATDFFDAASASADPRHRFMNWSLMTNGAWDFAADTRGYTWGVALALEQPGWAVRGAVTLMPTTPNGPIFDGDLAHARSEMVEGEYRYQVAGNSGAVKLLGYVNHGRMGAFSDALAIAAPGLPPDIDSVARRGAIKYGIGMLIDQKVGPVSLFLRASWNDGKTEEFAFTQIEHAVSAGAEIPTDGWGRTGDHVGAGLALNGLASPHIRYLEAGGVDFQLGDGRLRYALETVLETYYALRLGRNVDFTGDVQVIANPGMNADRGPAVIFGLRLHAHI